MECILCPDPISVGDVVTLTYGMPAHVACFDNTITSAYEDIQGEAPQFCWQFSTWPVSPEDCSLTGTPLLGKWYLVVSYQSDGSRRECKLKAKLAFMHFNMLSRNSALLRLQQVEIEEIPCPPEF